RHLPRRRSPSESALPSHSARALPDVRGGQGISARRSSCSRLTTPRLWRLVLPPCRNRHWTSGGRASALTRIVKRALDENLDLAAPMTGCNRRAPLPEEQERRGCHQEISRLRRPLFTSPLDEKERCCNT